MYRGYNNANLNIQIVIITSGEVPGELQDSVTILLFTTDQEPVLIFIDQGKEAINSKAVLHYGSEHKLILTELYVTECSCSHYALLFVIACIM